MNWRYLLLSFSGRINRKRYWRAILAVLVVYALAYAGLVLSASRLAAIPLVPLLLASIYAGLALGAKRLHDHNRSAWWLVLFSGAPPVLSFVATATGGIFLVVLPFVSLAISIWAIVEFGVLKGTAGPNRFGDDPLAVPEHPAG